MMIVLDASAMLAFLQGEPGAEKVGAALEDGACCSVANWSETAQKIMQRGGSWPVAKAVLLSYELALEPVTAADAETAAGLWGPCPTLSLGDRLCLALAGRLNAEALTTDRAWISAPGQIQIIR